MWTSTSAGLTGSTRTARISGVSSTTKLASNSHSMSDVRSPAASRMSSAQDVHRHVVSIPNRLKAPFTRYNLLSIRLSNRFDNRLHRVYKHSTGCQTRLTTGLTTGWMFVYTIQPVVKLVVQPLRQPVVSCKRGLIKQ